MCKTNVQQQFQKINEKYNVLIVLMVISTLSVVTKAGGKLWYEIIITKSDIFIFSDQSENWKCLNLKVPGIELAVEWISNHKSFSVSSIVVNSCLFE